MVYQSGTDDQSNQPALKEAMKTLPRWKWKLLGFALTLGILGVVGQAATMLHRGPTPVTTVTHTIPAAPRTATAPPGSSGFVGGQPATDTPQTTTVTTTTTQEPSTITQLATPFMTKVGFSVFVGVIVGVLFRTFLKMALLATTLIVGAAMALSYFHVFNGADLTAVKTDASQATSWLSQQGYHLRDMLFQTLPSSTSALVGFFLGFKRR